MIPIQNIYYMLSYAFSVLKEQGYKSVGTEKFDNTAELCAAILCKGISVQIKRGLGREYISRTEALSTPRGKLDISDSIKTQTLLKRQIVCTYDDFSVNSYRNRVIKSTMTLLLRSDISKSYKKELRKLLVYFGDVDLINVYTINWNMQYNRHNQTYRMLIAICWLVVKGLLQTDAEGGTKLMGFLDEQRMCYLYERFILEYYKREYPQIKVSASQVAWDLDDGFDELLPIMQSDITLRFYNRVLIIDAKYYSHTTQSRYGANTLRSDNLYQIFTYVKNMSSGAKARTQKVSGMLMYAGTDEEFRLPEKVYQMSGNQITVRTLNLDCDFMKITEQLNKVVEEHFDIKNDA